VSNKINKKGNNKMGYKVVTIEPDINWNRVFPEQKLGTDPIQVIFTWSKPKLENGKRNQTVTNCLLRQRLTPIGIGFSVENPNDDTDQMAGIHWAFKRALLSMFHRIEFKSGYTLSEYFKKDADKAFRKALWEAMNGNN